jgi:HD domain
MGEQIIAAAGPSLERIGPLVRASHERWDGMGYPDGLAGEEIPLGARIIAICDSFRAMMDERVYKSAMSLGDALKELRRCAGTQFDPELVEAFAAWWPSAPSPCGCEAPVVSPYRRWRGRARRLSEATERGDRGPRLGAHAAASASCALRRTEARRKASTTLVSNWLPAQRVSSIQASS